MSWIGVIRTAGFLISAVAAWPALAADRPNIVLIVADDLGWNDVGWHGSEIKTPHLDRLVSSSVDLDQHYVQPVCTPTRVAVMTGKYPSRFGSHCTVPSNEQAFPLGTPTMASLLKEAGYATGLFGKWHLGSRPEWGPNHYGFDYSYGSLAGAVGMYDHRYRLNTPYARTWHRNLQFIDGEVGHATDLVTSEAIQWLERHKDGPFFLYVPFQSVHTPLVEDNRWLKANEQIADADRRLYAAAVTHLDDCIGQIITALDRVGVRDRTLLIFTSDNGGQVDHAGNTYPPPDAKLRNFSSNSPLRGRKAQTFEGGIRVPAFVHWPGRLRPGKCLQPMHAVDWLPTLTRLLGISPPANTKWDGQDTWPWVSGQEAQPKARMFYWVVANQWFALRHGDWKIVRQGAKGAWMLFNLAEDPNESKDLASSVPDKLKELEGFFAEQKAQDAVPSSQSAEKE